MHVWIFNKMWYLLIHPLRAIRRLKTAGKTYILRKNLFSIQLLFYKIKISLITLLKAILIIPRRTIFINFQSGTRPLMKNLFPAFLFPYYQSIKNRPSPVISYELIFWINFPGWEVAQLHF